MGKAHAQPYKYHTLGFIYMRHNNNTLSKYPIKCLDLKIYDPGTVFLCHELEFGSVCPIVVSIFGIVD